MHVFPLKTSRKHLALSAASAPDLHALPQLALALTPSLSSSSLPLTLTPSLSLSSLSPLPLALTDRPHTPLNHGTIPSHKPDGFVLGRGCLS